MLRGVKSQLVSSPARGTQGYHSKNSTRKQQYERKIPCNTQNRSQLDALKNYEHLVVFPDCSSHRFNHVTALNVYPSSDHFEALPSFCALRLVAASRCGKELQHPSWHPRTYKIPPQTRGKEKGDWPMNQWRNQDMGQNINQNNWSMHQSISPIFGIRFRLVYVPDQSAQWRHGKGVIDIDVIRSL